MQETIDNKRMFEKKDFLGITKETVRTSGMKPLEQLKEFFDGKTKEIQWNAEYIAISLGFDRTPQADLVRVSQMTRQHFVMMKRDMDKKQKITKATPKHDQDER